MTLIASLLIAFVSSFTAAQAQPVRFSSTVEAGLQRSLDGGKTWEPANTGFTGSVVALAAAPSAPAVFYCATELEGIFRSDDYGLNWNPASRGLPVPLDHVTSAPLVAVDSFDSQWVY